jgi:hypothetical protein
MSKLGFEPVSIKKEKKKKEKKVAKVRFEPVSLLCPTRFSLNGVTQEG